MDGNLAGMRPGDEPAAITMRELLAVVAGAAIAITFASRWPCEQPSGGLNNVPSPAWFPLLEKTYRFLIEVGFAISPAIAVRLWRYNRISKVGEWSCLLLATTFLVQVLPDPFDVTFRLKNEWDFSSQSSQAVGRDFEILVLIGSMTFLVSLSAILLSRSLRESRWNAWRTVARLIAVAAALWGHLRIFAFLWGRNTAWTPLPAHWGYAEWVGLLPWKSLEFLVSSLVFGIPVAVGVVNLCVQPPAQRPWTARMGLVLTLPAGACWLAMHLGRPLAESGESLASPEVSSALIMDFVRFMPAAMICAAVGWGYYRAGARSKGQSMQ